MAYNVLVWDQIDHDRAQTLLGQLTATLRSEIQTDRAIAQFRSPERISAQLCQILEQRADGWVRRAYGIYCDLWPNQKSGDFVRAAWFYGIDPFIKQTGVELLKAGFAITLEEAKWLKLSPQGAAVSKMAHAKLGAVRRITDNVEKRWREELEKDASNLDKSTSLAGKRLAEFDVAPQPTGSAKSPEEVAMIDYPREFSPEARARIEAEMVRARRDFRLRRAEITSSYGPSAADEENFRQYVLRVFLAFAKEACKLGSLRVWTVDKITPECVEFLRRFTIQAYYEDGHDRNGRRLSSMTSNLNGSLLEAVERQYRGSEEWRQFEDALLAVAEQVATASHEDLSTAPPIVRDEPSETNNAVPVTGSIDKPGERRALIVDAFLQRCNERVDGGTKVIRKHIWGAIGHQQPRQFQYWQADDVQATEEDDQNFRRILSMEPSDFIAILKQKKLI